MFRETLDAISLGVSNDFGKIRESDNWWLSHNRAMSLSVTTESFVIAFIECG